MPRKEPLYPHVPKSKLIDPLGQADIATDPRSVWVNAWRAKLQATKFLDDIKKSIPDEEMASKEYADMANVAERLGHYGIADTLRGMSRDEGKHRGLLEDMLRKL